LFYCSEFHLYEIQTDRFVDKPSPVGFSLLILKSFEELLPFYAAFILSQVLSREQESLFLEEMSDIMTCYL